MPVTRWRRSVFPTFFCSRDTLFPGPPDLVSFRPEWHRTPLPPPPVFFVLDWFCALHFRTLPTVKAEIAMRAASAVRVRVFPSYNGASVVPGFHGHQAFCWRPSVNLANLAARFPPCLGGRALLGARALRT